LVAGQDVEPAGEPGQWRIAKRTTPDRVISVIDPQSRHTHKTSHAYRDGYKAHVAAEPDTGLVTDYDLTPGNTGDAEAAPGLIADEPEGTEALGDSAYASGELRAHLGDRKMTAVIKPRHCGPRSRVATASTTSPSTRPPTPSRVPRTSPSRSLRRVERTSVPTAAAARSATAAPPPVEDAPSPSNLTTTCSPPHEPKPPPTSSLTPTGDNGP